VEIVGWKMATKSLRPLPEKWHGLQDTEERYRKRYLDILMNPEVKELFIKKAKFWEVTRNFMKERGFLKLKHQHLKLQLEELKLIRLRLIMMTMI